jgi:ABC-type uncharacterized transport system substrate-binding protein
MAAHGALEALLRATRSVPIIFGSVTDPVGSGFVDRVGLLNELTSFFLRFS